PVRRARATTTPPRPAWPRSASSAAAASLRSTRAAATQTAAARTRRAATAPTGNSPGKRLAGPSPGGCRLKRRSCTGSGSPTVVNWRRPSPRCRTSLGGPESTYSPTWVAHSQRRAPLGPRADQVPDGLQKPGYPPELTISPGLPALRGQLTPGKPLSHKDFGVVGK